MKIKNVFSLSLLFVTPLAFCTTEGVKPAVSTARITSDVKVGYFNSAQVVGESKIGKDAFAEIEKKRQVFEADFKKDEASYTKKVKDLQSKASTNTMSLSAKQKAEEDLMKSKRDLENKAKGYEEDLRLAMGQAQGKIGQYLADAVTKYGKAEGKDLMIDIVSGQVYPINPERIGSTNSIVASLDAAYNKEKSTSKPTA